MRSWFILNKSSIGLSAMFFMAVFTLSAAIHGDTAAQEKSDLQHVAALSSPVDPREKNFAPKFGSPRAVVSTNLALAEGYGPFRFGQKLNATFTITNRGDADLVMKSVFIYTRVFDQCPCGQFTPQADITVKPGDSFKYSGSFVIPQKEGIYIFRIRYQKPGSIFWTSPDADIGIVDELFVAASNRLPQAKRGSALVSMNEDDGKKIPLILIHGIHGSDGKDTKDIKERNTYWNAFMSKFNADPVLKQTYARYVFQYYSDQEGVPELASQMGITIDDKLTDRPHVLLAHSMGGLVAKAYMVNYRHRNGRWAGTTGGDSTTLLITLATPHHGSPGANDTDAIDQYMGTGWKMIFSSVNWLYWADAAGFQSPPVQNSGHFNRSDLRWDNYDDAIPPNEDVHVWLSEANSRFKAYSSKVILYAGALAPRTDNLTPAGAIKRIITASGNHERLEFANDAMLYGLDRRFGITDGMVPYDSALLCDAGTFLSAPGSNFVCPSPARVRRFEPGDLTEFSVDERTLSITRRPHGYDHLDMLEDSNVLDWVVKDLKPDNRVVVSISLQLSPDKGPYWVGQNISGTFSITNKGRAELNTSQVLIAGKLGSTCTTDFCQSFTVQPGIKLAPGQTYNYTGNFTPSLAGVYTFFVTYRTAAGTLVMPVDSEKGTINKLAILVAPPPPTLSSSNPSSVVAGPAAQAVDLNGAGLSKILYCRVLAPDGKFSFIYIPLSQLVGRSDVLLQTKIKFPMRGKYIITAFTMDKGKSNDLEIVAR